MGSPKLRSALRALGITRRESTSAFALIPTARGHVMAEAVHAPSAAGDALRIAVRDSAFVERGTTWGERAVAGRPIDWAVGRRFEVAVFTDDQGVAFHLAGEHGSVAFAAEQLLASTRV
ncbi:MAG TPA: hypothetical protein VHM48_04725 [Candidatus Limnocylindrales bacterium]|nr:hypothetical protein [Candidatus Limnocylindrales bacterium]